MDIIDLNVLSGSEWVLVLVSGLIVGMAKAGIQGLGSLVVPIMAYVFGAKPSTGVLLPMLCFADFIAVGYYRRSAQWGVVLKLLPWTLVGYLIAIQVDSFVPVNEFKKLIGGCIIVCLAVLLWHHRRDKSKALPSGWWFGAAFGIMGGFTTMIGNAAGPIMAVYLLAMRLSKKDFVGTGAWFFLFVNLLKLPLQVWVWDNITAETFKIDLITLPFIVLGAVAGIWLVKKIPEKWFRQFVVIVTLLSAVMMLL